MLAPQPLRIMIPLPRLAATLLLAGLLSQCGVPTPPRCHRVPSGSRTPAPQLVDEARGAWEILGSPSRRQDWPAARDRYNRAVAKLFDQLRCGSGPWEARAATLGTRISTTGSDEVDPSKLDAMFPASIVDGDTLTKRCTDPGIGVPLVGWKETSPVGRKRANFELPNGLPYNLTAVIDFGRNGPSWHFQKRWKTDSWNHGSTRHPLAADWSAPNAFFWEMCELDNLLVQNVLLPERFTEETGLYFITPYDPDKIPVVFVHGLVSSPDAFKNMINELSPEPWFREKYQIWVYNYPTGSPWIYSSMNFRAKMREACAYARSKGHDRNLNRMVVVGHSMGGLLTRSSVTDPGDAFSKQFFKQPVGKLKLPTSTRRLIDDLTNYQPLTEPKRVVFLAVPHRGSPVANLGPAEWFARFIKLPKTLTVDLLDSTLLAVSDVVKGDDPTQRLPTSINSLSPKAPATVALNTLPLPKGITFHSVIGDRGRGDTPDSSDGVVPYWSSHVTPVASEKIVPSNHSVPNSPEAAAELKRILQLHLKSN